MLPLVADKPQEKEMSALSVVLSEVFLITMVLLI